MATTEEASRPVRHVKRWKRWIGYYLAFGVPLYVAMEVMPRISLPPNTAALIHLCVWLFLTAWGIYWVVQNSKAKERN